ncbi:hypothetical protein HanRHA438_Chr11g0495531 [Helianthus annuus]|uniref:Zinc finger, GRF-type n=1 Tax=Helianthus annuus TaxID=4232 RepID=A0A9K3HNI1_HELAN|nr:hypothetical protein HanXRQr2_Chr11g0482491 [Helianthus annuus]KAJ0500977.1 hypothetical protein HanHA300_Chr11g0395461 [Helianthus annuus]KAJ0508638.1 hypothetical protein HanIR_Chr11g0519471 [Helianthus annuus]KAJ0516869.1 hypothetical protein HanHA89_Chr11g0418671 [Helianthus annuus]KAJ0684874.1 hypothetical protein HanLR1_Chr11g0396101 [Helianthus annuus]
MSSGSSWTSNATVRSNAVCSCGAATCIRTSWTEANPGRRFLCCTDGCGLLRWIEPPISCPGCERILPSLLRLNKENLNLMRLKAKEAEARRLKFVLGVSWLLFLIYVVM